MNKQNIFNKPPLFSAIISMMICLFVRILSQSPFELIHKLDCNDIIPPIWLFNLLSLIWCFLFGYAAGNIIFCVAHGKSHGIRETRAYQGGLFFVNSFYLSLLWYPVLFGAERIFIALLISLSAVICSAICAYMWKSVSSISSLITAAYTLWSAYIVFILICVILQN